MFRSIFIFILFGFLFISSISAQPELDQTFGTGGKFVPNLNINGGTVDMLIEPDNKIVLVSSCANVNWGGASFCLIRLNPDGSPDMTFGPLSEQVPGQGYVYTKLPWADSNTTLPSVSRLNDGRYLAVGYATTGTSDNEILTVLVRYMPNGLRDNSFGNAGILSVNIFPGRNDYARKIMMQPDGKFLITGYSELDFTYWQFIARFNADGTLDSSFGTNGVTALNNGNLSTTGFTFKQQTDGKILVGGLSWSSAATTAYLVTRFNSNGSLDTSFGNGGLKQFPFQTSIGYADGISALDIQPDGKILALGNRNILYRLNRDGSTDTDFDVDGSIVPFAGYSTANDVKISGSGKITVIGHTDAPGIGGPFYYKVSRFMPSGTADNTFSDDGFLDIDVSNIRNEGATASAYTLDGKLVLGGKSANGSLWWNWYESFYSLAKLNAPPIQNAGISGKIINGEGKPVPNAFVTLKNGATIIASGRTNPFGYFRFQNIPTAKYYTISTRAKGSTFYDSMVLLDDTVTNYLIAGE